jgi:catalase
LRCGEAKQLLDLLKLEADAGLIVGVDAKLIKPFFAAIGQHRVWAGAEGQGCSGL